MLVESPCPVSQDKVTFDVRELEACLQPPKMDVPDYPPGYITLKGQTMVIRPAKEEEAEILIDYVRKLVNSGIEKDFYDVVGARVLAELIGWKRKRLKDPYTLVGLVDGHLVAFCNGRLLNEDVNISLHSMAFRRGLRAGATMYYAKCEYCFDVIGQKEFWATYESYNGFKRWGIGMAQPTYPFPETQHELGGAKVFYIRKDYWDTRVKKYLRDLVGTEIQRPVPPELLEKNSKILSVPDGLED